MVLMQVQPESDGLTANMEQNEEEQKEEEVKEVEKLGRLQFKLDYDFNSTNVRGLSLGRFNKGGSLISLQSSF